MIDLNDYYSVPISIKDDTFAEQLDWCLEHCNGHFKDHKTHGVRIWFFENKNDAMLFTLKWSDK